MEEKKKNIPQIRFEGFEGEWEEILFSNTYTYASEGGTPNTSISEYYDKGNIPFVKIEDTEAKYIYRTNNHITQEGVENSSAWIIPADNIVYTNGATIGNVSINKVPIATKQGILGVIPNKELFDLEYLYYSLSRSEFKEKVYKRQSKGTFATIILRNLDKIPLLLTSDTDEQQKIGEFFKELDELIEAKAAELEKMRQIKAALLEAMFPTEEDEDRGGYLSALNSSFLAAHDLIATSPSSSRPRIRFKGFTGDWKKTKLKKVCEISTGCSNKQDATTKGQYPFFVRSQNIERKDSYEYDEEAIIIPGEGSIGDIFHYINGKYALHQRVYRIHFLTTEQSTIFAFYNMMNNFKKYIMSMAANATVTSIRKPMIEQFIILYPSLPEQQKIGAFFRAQDDGITAAALQVERLKQMKQACLERMFA